MPLATLRSTGSGGSDATVTTAAALYGKITSCLMAAGWSRVYQYVPGSDEVYFSNGESGNEKQWIRIRNSNNDIQFFAHQYFHLDANPTGAPADSNTVGLWRMDEASGTTVADASGNGYHMTATAGATVVTGRIGNARNFARANSGAASVAADSTLQALAYEGEYTIECWVKPMSLTTYNGIFSITGTTAMNATELLGLYTNGYVPYIQWRNAADNGWVTVSSGTTIPADLWSHLAVTREIVSYDQYVVRFYVNGDLVFTSGNLNIGREPQGNEVMYIGRTIDTTNSYYWNGIIDDLRFSNVARSPEHIREIYLNGANVVGGHNRIGANTTSTAVFNYSFPASSTTEYLMVADKDHYVWYARNAAGTNFFGSGGLFRRPAGVKAGFLTTTNAAWPGKNVVLNLSANPIAAGYAVGDTVTILGQQYYGANGFVNSPPPYETAAIIPAFIAEIVAITTSSITVSSVPEKLEAGALVGDDPQPLYLFSSTTNIQPYNADSFATVTRFQPGASNIFMEQSTMGNGHTNNIAPFSFSQAHAASCAPNNRTGRMLFNPWHISERGYAGSKFFYHPRQSDPLWAIIRDAKAAKDYVVFTISSVKHVMGPFPQAGTPTFTGVQVTDNPAEHWSEGMVVVDPAAGYFDCGMPETTNGTAEQFHLDDGALLQDGDPLPLHPNQSPELAGTGPYLMGDGDRVGGGGGSHFNNEFN